MTPEALRLDMAHKILDFEARRDSRERLLVYNLPDDDGGGSYEVAGICERYHPEAAEALKDLIVDGQYGRAEVEATKYIASYTDPVARWTQSAVIEFYFRDCMFNRGMTGAAKIVQIALGLTVDGIVGPKTRAAVADAEKRASVFLKALRQAREIYERDYVHRDESSRFWSGLVNRWNGALTAAQTYLT